MKKIQKKRSENEITKAIREILKAFGIFHWKVWQGLGSEKGVSDIVGIKVVSVDDLVKAGIKKVGVFTAIEIKSEGALKCPYNCKHKTCREQGLFLDAVNFNGGIGFVARMVDDVIENLKLRGFK